MNIHNVRTVVKRVTNIRCDVWLSAAIAESERLLPRSHSYPSRDTEAHPVSRAINSPVHDGPDVLIKDG